MRTPYRIASSTPDEILERPEWAREILARRRQANLTQQALAERVGLSRPWVVFVEIGRLKPSPERFAQLLAAIEEASQ